MRFLATIAISSLILAGCSGGSGGSIGGGSLGGGSLGGGSSSGSFGGSGSSAGGGNVNSQPSAAAGATSRTEPERETIWDLFNAPDPNTDFGVNKYLWNASLDALSFLPLETADPYTGILNFGFGRAPGSSQLYRATVRISSINLEGASLAVAVFTRGGPASAETTRQIENAILTRARELRIADLGR